jgi:hypothetical protein
LPGVHVVGRCVVLVALAAGTAHADDGGIRTLFDADDLRRLPSGRDVLSLLETAEPVTVTDRIDGGGLWTADPPRLTAHGGSWTETTYLLDGVDITDPLRGGRPLVLPQAEALASATLLSAAAPADVPGSAAVIALAVRGSPSAWAGAVHGDASFGPAAAGEPPPRERLEGRHDLGLMGSGPAAGGRLGLLGAFEWRGSSRTERGGTTPLHSRLASALASASCRATARDTIRLTTIGQWATRPADPGLWRGGGEAHDTRAFAGAHGEHRGDDGARWITRVTYAHMRTRGLEPQASIERLQDGPVTEQVEERPAARDRAEAGAMFHPRLLHAGGEHDARLGLSVSRSSATLEPFAATVGERIGGVAARAWEYASGAAARPRSHEAALTASDRFTAGRLSADVGMKVDVVRGRSTGPPRGIRWWGIAPALSLRWSALSGERLVLWGAVARRPHRLLLSWLAWGDPAAPRAQVRRWTDANTNGVVDTGEGSIVIGRTGPGAPVGSLDPRLRRPVTDELVLGIESRLGEGLLVRFAGVDRRQRHRLESVNVGLDPTAYSTRLLSDPGGDLIGAEDDQLLPLAERRASGDADLLRLSNPSGLDARYRGVELTFDLRLRDRLRLRLAGTAHRVDGKASSRGFRATEDDPGLIGELFDAPNAGTNAQGRLFFDRAYTVKLSGRLRAPGDVHLGWVARYQDGQPFARLVLVPDLPQGADFVRAVPNGRHRFAYALTVDVRVEKGIRVGGRRVSASLEAFNLLQTRHEVEEDVVTGPAFRTPTYVQPPRTLRAGVRLDF